MAAPRKSPRRETDEHLKAFEYWLSVGANLNHQTIELVAEKFKRCERTIRYWWTDFNWRDRADVDSIVDKHREELLAKVDEIVIKSREDLLEISSEALDQFQQALRAHKVPVRRIMDFINLAKLQLTMQGQPTGDETNITIITAIPRPRQEVDGEVFQNGTGELEVNPEALPPHEED